MLGRVPPVTKVGKIKWNVVAVICAAQFLLVFPGRGRWWRHGALVAQILESHNRSCLARTAAARCHHYGVAASLAAASYDLQMPTLYYSILQDLRDYQNFRKAGQGVPTITAIGVTFLSPRTGAIYDKLESNLK